MISTALFSLMVILCWSHSSHGIELVFKVSHSDEQCFYEFVQKNVSAMMEFQVIDGGQYDVDVFIKAPNDQLLYKKEKASSDSHHFFAPVAGVYTFCFSNDFSSFSEKQVYMSLEIGEELPLSGGSGGEMVVSNISKSIQALYELLDSIISLQTHHRLQESQGRKRAEELNNRIMWWSAAEAVTIIAITAAQVFEVKRFFIDKKPKMNIPLYSR